MENTQKSPEAHVVSCFQCGRPAVGGDGSDSGRCRYCNLADEALEAFWEVILRHFPEAKHGDLSPERTIRQIVACVDAIEEWIDNNVPSEQEQAA